MLRKNGGWNLIWLPVKPLAFMAMLNITENITGQDYNTNKCEIIQDRETHK